jgi:hypothetical protein
VGRDWTEEKVTDFVRLKLFEMAHRQNIHGAIGKGKKGVVDARHERSRLMELEERKAQRTLIGEEDPVLGSSRKDILKWAYQGQAAMNTKRIMFAVSLGKTQMFAWKKRAKMSSWIEQSYRREDIPLWMASLLPEETRALERTYRGAVSYSTNLGKHYFNQASLYKLLVTYGKN